MNCNANLSVPMNVCLYVKNIYVHAHLSNSCKGYNYVPVEFCFCKFYCQGANIFSVMYQINTSVSQTQCFSVFCGLISHTSFTENLCQTPIPNPLEYCLIIQKHCCSSIIFLPLLKKPTNTIVHLTLPHWYIGMLLYITKL